MNNNCCLRGSCTLFAVIASAIIGVITAFLTFSATITVTPAFLWVLLGIAVGYLAVTLATTAFLSCRREGVCPGRVIGALIAGILGTILTSVILLGFTFAATSVIGAIITGLLLFFFSLTIGETACYALCLAQGDN